MTLPEHVYGCAQLPADLNKSPPSTIRPPTHIIQPPPPVKSAALSAPDSRRLPRKIDSDALPGRRSRIRRPTRGALAPSASDALQRGNRRRRAGASASSRPRVFTRHAHRAPCRTARAGKQDDSQRDCGNFCANGASSPSHIQALCPERARSRTVDAPDGETTFGSPLADPHLPPLPPAFRHWQARPCAATRDQACLRRGVRRRGAVGAEISKRPAARIHAHRAAQPAQASKTTRSGTVEISAPTRHPSPLQAIYKPCDCSVHDRARDGKCCRTGKLYSTPPLPVISPAFGAESGDKAPGRQVGVEISKRPAASHCAGFRAPAGKW